MEELSIEAKTENLDAVLSFISEKLKAADCSVKHRRQIAIVAEEVFVNIARYAYNPAVGQAVIRVVIDDAGEVTVEFKDGGKPYDPLSKDDPDITLTTEDRDIGGLGIYMTKKMMDKVDYKRMGDWNVLTLSKQLF